MNEKVLSLEKSFKDRRTIKMKQMTMNTNTVCSMNISRSLSVLANTVAAFTCGVRFFAYSVFYYFYFYFGKIDKDSQRILAV